MSDQGGSRIPMPVILMRYTHVAGGFRYIESLQRYPTVRHDESLIGLVDIRQPHRRDHATRVNATLNIMFILGKG